MCRPSVSHFFSFFSRCLLLYVFPLPAHFILPFLLLPPPPSAPPPHLPFPLQRSCAVPAPVATTRTAKWWVTAPAAPALRTTSATPSLPADPSANPTPSVPTTWPAGRTCECVHPCPCTLLALPLPRPRLPLAHSLFRHSFLDIQESPFFHPASPCFP